MFVAELRVCHMSEWKGGTDGPVMNQMAPEVTRSLGMADESVYVVKGVLSLKKTERNEVWGI